MGRNKNSYGTLKKSHFHSLSGGPILLKEIGLLKFFLVAHISKCHKGEKLAPNSSKNERFASQPAAAPAKRARRHAV